MAHHKSAIKRIRTSEKARLANRAYKKRLKRLTKELYAAENKETAEPTLKKAASLLDRLAVKNILHRNNAAHKKSQLTRYVNSLS